VLGLHLWLATQGAAYALGVLVTITNDFAGPGWLLELIQNVANTKVATETLATPSGVVVEVVHIVIDTARIKAVSTWRVVRALVLKTLAEDTGRPYYGSSHENAASHVATVDQLPKPRLPQRSGA
jgi:hypothetical protein